MNLSQLLLKLQTALKQHGDIDVIVQQRRPRDEWEIEAADVNVPHSPWEGGDAVFVLTTAGPLTTRRS